MKKNSPLHNPWLYPIVVLVLVVIFAGGVFLSLQAKARAAKQVAVRGTANNPATEVSNATSAAVNDPVDPGSSLDGRPAPQFTLTDQFGKQVSLSDFKGKVVILAFVDSQCTTICPLTTEAMMRAMQMIGPKAAKDVQLLGIDANPKATSIADVRTYSKDHNMMKSWHFLTGSLTQLKSLWKNYYIYTQIVNGQIDHTPALYIIGPNGKEQYLFLTPSQYAAVDAQASVLAHQVAKFLPQPVRPTLKSVAYHAPGFSPKQEVSVPLAEGSGKVKVGPGQPQLLVYFASWVPGVKQDLEALDKYAASAGAPEVVGVDVLTTEPGNKPDAALLKAAAPKHYRIVSDETGQLADAYGVSDMMWLSLTDGHGHIIWSHDGWLPTGQLKSKVAAALKKANA